MSQQSSDEGREDNLYSSLVEDGGIGQGDDVAEHPAVGISSKRRKETQDIIRRKPAQPDTWAAGLSKEDMEYYVESNFGIEGATEDLDKALEVLTKVRTVTGEEILPDKNAIYPRDICDKCIMALLAKGYDL